MGWGRDREREREGKIGTEREKEKEGGRERVGGMERGRLGRGKKAHPLQRPCCPSLHHHHYHSQPHVESYKCSLATEPILGKFIQISQVGMRTLVNQSYRNMMSSFPCITYLCIFRKLKILPNWPSVKLLIGHNKFPKAVGKYQIV